jgi:hypothetical protein
MTGDILNTKRGPGHQTADFGVSFFVLKRSFKEQFNLLRTCHKTAEVQQFSTGDIQHSDLSCFALQNAKLKKK